MASYELEPIAWTLRVYDGDPDDYVAVAQVRTYGDVGWVSSISSPRLFLAFPSLPEVMDRLGVDSLEGYMSPAMARAVRMRCRGHAEFSVKHEGKCAGRKMPWVVIRRLPAG